MNKIFCQKCNKVLKENEKICSSCGSPNKHYQVDLKECIILNDGFAWKQKRPGHKKAITEGFINRLKKSKDPKLSGQEVKETYRIDREHYIWKQAVIDPTPKNWTIDKLSLLV